VGSSASATATADEKKARVPSPFVILVRAKGADAAWTQLPSPVQALTQDAAKNIAARSLVNDETYGPTIQGDGLEIAAVTVRSFKPVVVRVEPQPAKVVVG
jgi:hypothetical protein